MSGVRAAVPEDSSEIELFFKKESIYLQNTIIKSRKRSEVYLRALPPVRERCSFFVEWWYCGRGGGGVGQVATAYSWPPMAS